MINYGAHAVHQPSICTVKIQQKPVASVKQVLYNHTHNGWIALVKVVCSLPHNPSVPCCGESCSWENPSALAEGVFTK